MNGRKVDDKKLTLLDFSFSLFKTKQKLLRQKTVAAGEYEKEKEVLSVNLMVRRLRMFHWALQHPFSQFERVPNFMNSQALSCLTVQMTRFLT